MKSILIFLAVLLLNTIGAQVYSQGNTCADPIIINSLPYDLNNFDACGYGNDYNNPDVPCGGAYMNGDEIVLAYTPSSDEDIYMSYQVSAWEGSIFVFDACPFSSANCLYVATDPDTGDDIAICGLSFEANHTYYIVFSYDDDDDWNHCNDYSYDFHLETINPTVAPTTQDCLGAIPVCQDTYTESNSYVGNGNVNCEVNTGTTCISWGAFNYVWYTFTVQTSGQLSFDITPNNSGDDYDWALYDLDNYTCDELYDAPNSDLSCNFDGLDNTNNPNSLTGICSGCNGNNGYENSINVTAGQTFALMVNNFSSSQNGYTLDFSPSTAEIYDNIPPEFESVNLPIICGATELTFTMSENIMCNTADASDIQLTGPGGPYSVTNISSTICDLGGQYDNTFTITVSPALTSSGNFNLSLSPSGSFSDFCGNVANSASFDFVIDNINLTTTVTDINDCTTLCDGSIAITNPTGGTAPYTYAWSHDGSLTSATASNLCENTYTVTVSDAAGCNAVFSSPIVLVANCGPSIVLDASPSTICSGESTTLTQTTTNGAPTYTYNWDNGLSGAGPHTVSPTSTTTYNVTVTDSNNDSETTSVTVTVNPLPTPTASSNSPVCVGQSLSLTGEPTGMTYSWSGPNSYSDATQSPEVSSSATTAMTGTYTLSVTDNNSCSNTITTDVIVNALPNVTASSNSAVCEGESLSLTGTPAGMTNYTWSGPNSFSNNTQSPEVSSSATSAMSGTYTLSVTDNNSCSNTATTDVTVNSLPNPTASNNGPVCEGTTLTLTGSPSGFVIYSWTGPNSYIDMAENSTVSNTANLSMAGVYTLEVTDMNLCTNTATTTVVVNENPTVSATASMPVICPPETSTLTAVGEHGDGSYTYNWAPDATLDDVTDNISPIASPSTINTNFTYTVSVTDGNTCVGTNTVDVYVSCNPVPSLSATNTEICAGESVTIDINVLGGVTPYQTPYQWDNGLSGTGSQTVSPTSTTTYCVTVTDNNGATGSDCITITVNPVPVANAGADVTICEGESTTLLASGGSTYNWSIPANGQSQNVSPNTTTIYTVTVTDNSPAQCSSTDNVTVTVNPIPNADAGADIDICLGESTDITATGGSSYLWSNNETTSSINVNPTQTTTYTVTVSNLGCSSTDEMNVIIHGVPSLDAGEDQDICSGEDAILQAIGSGSFVWSNGLGNSQQVTANPINTTTYTVSLTDTYGCTAQDNVTVNVYSIQNIQTNPSDTTICFDTPINLSVTGADNYTWFPSYGLNTTEGSVVVANPAQTTTYTVSGEYGPGCISHTTVTVTVDKVIVDIPNPENACIGETVTLIASVTSGISAYTYLWEGTGITTAELSVPLEETQSFTVSVLDHIGCTGTASTQVYVYDSLHIQVYANTDYVCPGDTILVNTNIYGGTGSPYTLTMDGEYAQNIQKIRILENHDYAFVATDGCMSVTDTLRLNTYPLPSIDFTANKYSLCEGESVTFNSRIIPENLVQSFLWSFGSNDNNNLSLSKDPVHIFENQGLNSVSLRIETTDGCVVDTTKYNMIRVDPLPVSNFNIYPEITSIIKPEIYFENLTEGNNNSYYWNFDFNGDESNIRNPIYTYNSIGNHEVMLVASTNFGCRDTIYRTVRIEPEIKIWMPTAFTPDQDNINDTFGPKGTNILDAGYQMLIFNRWGEQIFESNDFNKGWNGKAKDNKYVKPGIYPYYVKYKDIYNISHELSGLVNVIW